MSPDLHFTLTPNPWSMSIRIIFLSLFFFTACQQVEFVPNSNLSVYPNPVLDQAHVLVNNPSGAPFKLSVFGTRGDILLKESGSAATADYPVNLQGESVGNFLVVLELNGKTLTQKVEKYDR
jgi:hypothetical protein